tara:strand:- start:23 stop:244 length:222 start_codon:yes stop_codon:yes gene_type:complete
VIIKWLVNKIIPFLQRSEGMLNIYRRLDEIEKNSHSPLFEKEQLHKIHRRLEDLETIAFVKKFDKYKNYEGTD